MDETASGVRVRIHGSAALPCLIYLPGIHGDWTLVSSFREAVASQVRFVEITYPRTTSWTLEEYATGIETTLLQAGIRAGWLIGESFGSQPAWEIIGRGQRGMSALEIHGLVLAGGFVKHPWPWGARLLRWLTCVTPRAALWAFLQAYALYARFRHRHAPATLASVDEFVANRLHPDDPAAWMHRYTIVAESDVRAAAAATELPVFHLTGLVDPIVPGPLVRRWLRRNCPGCRASQTILGADHNVLGTAPEQSAETILRWISQCASPAQKGPGRAPH